MTTQDHDNYIEALGRVISVAEYFVGTVTHEPESTMFALSELTLAVEKLNGSGRAHRARSGDREKSFLDAAAEMQGGLLLIEAGRAIESGDVAPVRNAIQMLTSEKEELERHAVVPLLFEADLLRTPAAGSSDEEALEIFKSRAIRTLDNMVTEARDVIAATIDKFRHSFESFAKELGELARSFSAGEAGSLLKAGLEKIISGLKMLSEYLHNDALEAGIEGIRKALNLDLGRVLASTFGCEATKSMIGDLKLGPSVNRTNLADSVARMTDLSSRYVVLLRGARWVITAVGVVGGLLVMTGVVAHYAALGVPIAYAIVAVATVMIGVDFAESKMRGLVASL